MPVLFAYLRNNPGLALSVSYASLTMCGMLYSASFYHEFNVSILKLANISDLLIVGFSEPAAMLMFMGGLLVAWSADRVTLYFYRKQQLWQEKPKSIQRRVMMLLLYSPTKSSQVIVMMLMLFVMYAYLFVSEFAKWQSKRIKTGHGRQVLVHSQAAGIQSKSMILLGSTTEFLFVYDPTNERAEIIPVENIDKLQAPKIIMKK